MPKYRFSQGKVWVEAGVYRPCLNRNRQTGPLTVLFLRRPGLSAPAKPSALVQEERPDAQPESPPVTPDLPGESRPDLSA